MLKHLLFLVILSLISITLFSAYAVENNNSTISIWTDKTFYERDSMMKVIDMVEVNGNITNPSGLDITITIISPLNSIVTIHQLTVADDGSFETTLNSGGAMWKYNGTYTIEVSYGDFERVPMTTFEIGKYSSLQSLTITTNNPTYTAGETIQISGEFPTFQNPTSLNISLQSPTHGFLGTMYNVTTNNNSYTTSMSTGNNTSISTPGTYTLTANYGTDTASTTFDYYSHPTQHDNEYFIPNDSYLILSDQQISQWNNQILQWENAQNRTDNKIDRLYDKLDRAITRNNTNQIEQWTVEIGQSMALSQLYDVIIECLQEQIQLLS